MSTYLYCLIAPPGVAAPPPGLSGIDGAAVRAITTGEVDAWVSTVSAEITPTPERARMHDQVVEAAMALGTTPLPARFGQRFASDDACLADLRQRAPALLRSLARVADTVEMGILVTRANGANGTVPDVARGGIIDAAAPGAGHRYLESVRERERDRTRWQELVDEQVAAIGRALGELIRDAEPVEARRGMAAGVAHLVPRGSVAHYRERVHDHPVPPQLRLVITGPRAPYNFAADRGQRSDGTILAN